MENKGFLKVTKILHSRLGKNPVEKRRTENVENNSKYFVSLHNICIHFVSMGVSLGFPNWRMNRPHLTKNA